MQIGKKCFVVGTNRYLEGLRVGAVLYLWCTMHFKTPQNMTPQSDTNKGGKKEEKGF
jgi:hypothetical protein